MKEKTEAIEKAIDDWKKAYESETNTHMREIIRRTILSLNIEKKTGVAITTCCLLPFEKSRQLGKCEGLGNRDNGKFDCNLHHALKCIK